MYILGLNAFHGDASACLFKDGNLVMAIEEERIRRIKHWAGFPSEAIKACLSEAGIGIQNVHHIAVSRDPSAHRNAKIRYALGKLLQPAFLLDRFKNQRKVASIGSLVEQSFNLSAGTLKSQVHAVEHHRAHLASAFFASPWENAALLSIDGMGDFTSTMTGIGAGNAIMPAKTVHYPHSLGIFYTAFTQWLGFPHYGDEYKVMGLAPYGTPQYVNKVRLTILSDPDGLFHLEGKYFSHFKKGVEMAWEDGIPSIGTLFNEAFCDLFGPARTKDTPLDQYHKDMAASVQRVAEETIFHLLTHLHQETGLDRVCIAGGVAQNSVANGKIYANTPFKEAYFPPAAHDAGTSIGAALWVQHQILGMPRGEAMRTAGLGSRFNPAEIEAAILAENLTYTRMDADGVAEAVTECLLNGGVVGWFQGRAEFGPRALGFRSILADPRRADAKDILNLKIKKRESFRPFAPSILKEYVSEYFETQDEVPFMEKVFRIRPEKHSQIPAVTHVDGTGRLQTVSRDTNPRYYTMIERFRQKTGVPIVLNTSFNENEPIVNSPKDALSCFLRTQMDMIVLDDFVVSRRPSA